MYLRTRDPSNSIPFDSPHSINLDKRLSRLLMRSRESGIYFISPGELDGESTSTQISGTRSSTSGSLTSVCGRRAHNSSPKTIRLDPVRKPGQLRVSEQFLPASIGSGWDTSSILHR